VFRAYATQVNNAASDGDGRNSPFTKALLKHIETKGLSIQELMIRVRKSVMQETNNEQVPWEEAALNETFYFAPQEKSSPTAAGPGSPSSPSSSRSSPPPRQQAGSRPSNNVPPNIGVGAGAGF
jgi:uncharacterized caspase-like protein